jgi:hypothetical protein
VLPDLIEIYRPAAAGRSHAPVAVYRRSAATPSSRGRSEKARVDSGTGMESTTSVVL